MSDRQILRLTIIVAIYFYPAIRPCNGAAGCRPIYLHEHVLLFSPNEHNSPMWYGISNLAAHDIRYQQRTRRLHVQTSLFHSAEVRALKASRTATFRRPVFNRMKEYRLGMHSNACNALRSSVTTLALVFLPEHLWICLHSRRTGARAVCGLTARLRQRRLAHWGLHQEVDEESRLSRFSAIFVRLLHIAGERMIEFESGTAETYL